MFHTRVSIFHLVKLPLPTKIFLWGDRVGTGLLNLLTPNVNYSGHTAPLTSKVAFYIFTQQI